MTNFTRREFLGASGAAVATVMPESTAVAAAAQHVAPKRVLQSVTLVVNGAQQPLVIDSRTSLLDALREQLDLTGAKKGCDHGQCGSCTVHVDGRRVLSCLTLAVMAGNGQRITTIEGLSSGAQLHPMQQAFIDHDALQCGYCTPGQVMSAVACVHEGHARSPDEIREFMSGNLCRCAAYPNIVAAIEQARSATAKAAS